MVNDYLSNSIIRPISIGYVDHRRLKPPENSIFFIKQYRNRVDNRTTRTRIRRLSSVQQPPPKSSEVDVQQLVDFLYEDLPHVFDDQGINLTAYDEHLKFQDPICKYDSIRGYLFNIAMLKLVFSPNLQLHWVRQTGPYEITTRWTVEMTYALLPWKPLLVITGTSVMDINPENGKFCSHVDYWDSINTKEYFSSEGLLDIIKHLLLIYKTPDLETPKYQILKRTATYEVYMWEEFEKRKTQAFDPEMYKMSIQIVLPSDKDLRSLPLPKKEEVGLREVEGGFAAVLKFSGKPTDDIVREKEKLLRSSLLSDGLKPKEGCLLARYNEHDQTKSFMMRNEVLIWLEEFSLD